MKSNVVNTSHVVIFILLQITSGGSCLQNKTIINLHQHIFKNYVKDVRPVMNVKTTTNVTYRVAFRSLLALETRDQKFTVGAILKATWTDEFLTWDPDEYNGIKKFNAPITTIWTPDITLIENADIGFESTKPGTRAQIYSDGTIIWYAPVIYTVSCKIRVRWFPYDTQVCDMVFVSWSYDGFGINLEPERSPDDTLNRYDDAHNCVRRLFEYHCLSYHRHFIFTTH
ncbi:neuronal acetylcholine receptor subunit beta-3-like [Amphiura filiformis]|uniref:neuronal acetylcholine receptor subunit beta-3-like n=1 Tax=Amphiura filiformis TaxID=82378 RepID=UPI003B20FA49